MDWTGLDWTGLEPESAGVRRTLADSGGQSAGLRWTPAGLCGPVQSIDLLC